MRRLIVWKGTDAERFEVAHLDLADTGVRATGTQVAVDPEPYRLDYELDAADAFVTRSLELTVTAEGWSRRLLLRHDGSGGWRWEAAESGRSDLPAPGAARELAEQLTAARDCDLGLSPLTNLMPVRRHNLRRPGTSVDLVTAWVSVPDLAVHAYAQRYEHVRADGAGATVRFIDRGLSPGFLADLRLDADGLILVYPELARRL